MWDSGQGKCVGCGKDDDRDVLGRCISCFKNGVFVTGVYFKEMGVENPADKKGSTVHVRDIKARRLDLKTKQPYYDKGQTTYFIPKGKL